MGTPLKILEILQERTARRASDVFPAKLVLLERCGHYGLLDHQEADASRVCVFGRSRGGTVALLTGIHEKHVDCLVSWAAPTD